MARQEVQAGRAARRPEPDTAPLDEPTPRGWFPILRRAGKRMLDDNMLMIAQALAYSTFLAIPSVLLVVLGVFTMVAGPATITNVIQHLGSVMPAAAQSLLSDSLHRLDHQHGTTILLTIVGFVLAIWSTTGAMTSYMTALNLAHERRDGRSFVKKRLTALVMSACIGVAFLLVAVFLLFGPTIEKYVGRTLGIESVLKYVWWSAQWPILVGGLLAAFAVLLYLGPDVDHRRWRFITAGSAVAVFIWLAVSAAFAFYTAHFSSYNKTWGSLSAVIVMLVWLWLTALALLFGAEIDAVGEKSRGGARDQAVDGATR